MQLTVWKSSRAWLRGQISRGDPAAEPAEQFNTIRTSSHLTRSLTARPGKINTTDHTRFGAVRSGALASAPGSARRRLNQTANVGLPLTALSSSNCPGNALFVFVVNADKRIDDPQALVE
jgi:hypothetical protein